jgi:CCR4-NOT transcription complex subunit 6
MSNSRKFKYINKSNDSIRIITYNILAPIATNGDKHQVSCPEDCINWKYRFNLIKEEVLQYKPDIINFQETQTSLVYTDLLPFFYSQGYQGYYNQGDSERQRNRENQRYNFGVMIFFNIDRFYLLKFGMIEYYKLAKNYAKEIFYSRIDKRFSSCVLKLKDKKTNKEFFILTVHLESNPLFTDIKNLQSYIIMKYIEKISEKNKIPIILTGDFNSKPDSSVYMGITTGKSTNIFDSENLDYDKPFIKTPKIFTKYPLKSCYKVVFGKEPLYSNYTINFKATLDYIFVNSNIKILGALKELNKKYFIKNKSIPNYDFPSDHFLQAVDIQIK